MYVPEHFSLKENGQAFGLIEQIRLGTLVAMSPDPDIAAFQATHIPFMVDRNRGDKGVLIGHVARANPHAHAMRDGDKVLAVFLGPAAYVSPSWYHTAPRAPTWIYVSVQAQGRVTLVTAPAALKEMVLRLCDESEPSSTGWRSRDLPDSFVDRLINGIVGFEIEIDSLEGAARLGQNNDLEDRRRVARALADGEGQQPITRLMHSVLKSEAVNAKG